MKNLKFTTDFEALLDTGHGRIFLSRSYTGAVLYSARLSLPSLVKHRLRGKFNSLIRFAKTYRGHRD